MQGIHEPAADYHAGAMFGLQLLCSLDFARVETEVIVQNTVQTNLCLCGSKQDWHLTD
jgi:hypothetical protein